MASIEICRISDLVPRTLRDQVAYNVIDTLAALKDGARVFLRRSEAWQERLAAIDVVANQRQYTLATEQYATILRVRRLFLRSSDEVIREDDGTEIDPHYYRLALPLVLEFNSGRAPVTAVTDGMLVDVVLIPRWDAEEIPQWIVERYGDAIIGYAMYQLLRGSDQKKAAEYLAQYNTALSEAIPENAEEITP